MNLEETVTLITWINQTDPRIQINKATRDVWAHSMAPLDYDEARQAVLEHYRTNEALIPNPGSIRKRALAIRSSREAFKSATSLEAPQPVKHPLSWRARNPELWDQLFEAGRAEGNAERKRATERRNGNQEPEHADWMAA